MEIKDSGERREFETGAVRDIQEGKGRCDLIPLDILGDWNNDYFIKSLSCGKYGSLNYYLAIDIFVDRAFGRDRETAMLELSKHYEEGARKYGEHNWEKGIPTHCYLDSAIRHYLKWKRGDNDEPHDRAVLWNLFGLLWTLENKPELNDLPKGETNETK